MPEMTLEQFAQEQKGLWDAMGQKIGDHRKDIDKVLKGFEDFKAESQALKASIEGIETKLNRPDAGGNSQAKPDAQKQAFDSYFRKGLETVELKALATDDNTTGGYRIPANVSSRIIEDKVVLSPILDHCTVETIGQGNYLDVDVDSSQPTINNTTERTTPVETTTPNMGVVRIFAETYDAYPKATQQQLDDSGFDVESWLMGKLPRAFSKKIATDMVLGTGVNKCHGFTTDTNVVHKASTDATHVTIAGCKAQYFGLNADYRKNAIWAMNSVSLAYLYGLEDSTTRPLIQPDLKEDFDFRLMGKGIVEFPDLTDPGAGLDPIYFGDFREFYTAVMRKEMTVLRDPYSSKPWVLFWCVMRIGGRVVHAEAVNKQRCEAS